MTDTIPVLPIDTPNGNGRIYRRALVEKIVEEFKDKKLQLKSHATAWDQDMFVSVIPSSYAVIGEVTGLKLTEAFLLADIDTAPEVWARIRSGEVAVRTSGYGTFEADGKTLADDYKMLGCFLTNDPA